MDMLTLRLDLLVASRGLQQEWLSVSLVTRVSGMLPVQPCAGGRSTLPNEGCAPRADATVSVQGQCTAAKALCGYDFDPHFC